MLRVFLFAPAVVTPIVTAYLWRNLLGPDGAVNSLLAAVGLDRWRQDWLGDPQLALWSIVAVIVWQFAGYSMVIFLAGLQSIPREIYEAAAIDGSGPGAAVLVGHPAVARARVHDQPDAVDHRRDQAVRPGVRADRRRSGARDRHALDADLQGRVHAGRVRLQHRARGRAHDHRGGRVDRPVRVAGPQREGGVMNRYRWRTFGLELVMVAVARGDRLPGVRTGQPRGAARRRTPRRRSGRPPRRPWTTSPRPGRQGALGGALMNSALVTVVSVVIVLAVSSLAAYPLARVTARWSRGMFLLIMLGLMLPFQLAALPLYQTMRDLGLLGSAWALILFYSGSAGAVHHVPLHRIPAGAAARLRGRRADRRLHTACRRSGSSCSRCSSRSP